MRRLALDWWPRFGWMAGKGGGKLRLGHATTATSQRTLAIAELQAQLLNDLARLSLISVIEYVPLVKNRRALFLGFIIPINPECVLFILWI